MFPLDTMKFASHKANRLKEALHAEGKDISPQNLARKLYEHDSGIGFGYWEAVQQGIWFRYPHEIHSQAECGEQTVYLYVVSQALGLKPRIFLLENVEDTPWYYPGPSNHLTIDVEVDRKRVAIDPLFRSYGPVEIEGNVLYLPQTEKAEQGDIRLSEGRRIKAGSLVQLSEEDLVGQIQELRKPRGLLKMLSACLVLTRDVHYPGVFPSVTHDIATFDTVTNMLTFDAHAIESVGTDSVWQRTYAFKDGKIEPSDAVADMLVNPNMQGLELRMEYMGKKRMPLDGQPNLRHAQGIDTYFEYRRRILKKAEASGRKPEDTHLTPALNKPEIPDLTRELLGLPPSEEFKKFPDTLQRFLRRRSDFLVWSMDYEDEPRAPAQDTLKEYISLKFPKAKFQPHLKKADYLAERVREVL